MIRCSVDISYSTVLGAQCSHIYHKRLVMVNIKLPTQLQDQRPKKRNITVTGQDYLSNQEQHT